MKKNEVEYKLASGIARIICSLSLKTALLFGKGLGLFFYYLVPIRKKVATANIHRSFPGLSSKEIKKIVKNTYINFALNIIEFMRYPVMTREYLYEHIKMINFELIEQAEKQGRGAILMSGHFGNWELLGAAIAAHGFPMVGAVKEQRNKKVDTLIMHYRDLVGIETLHIGMGIRGLLKSLKQNKFVVLVADQDAHSQGVFVDFLSRPSSTAPGPATIALKTKAPIIFGSCVRDKNGYHTAYIELIDHSDLDGATPENIAILTQRHATALENSIKKWPDHWLWMHKRWKTRPSAPDEKDNVS